MWVWILCKTQNWKIRYEPMKTQYSKKKYFLEISKRSWDKEFNGTPHSIIIEAVGSGISQYLSILRKLFFSQRKKNAQIQIRIC
jgi:hypothetical protein